MIFTKIRDLKYINKEETIIDLFATCEEYGEIPMTLNLEDSEDIHTFINNEGLEYKLEEYCKTKTIEKYTEPEKTIPALSVPNSITQRQARLYLFRNNLLEQLESLIKNNVEASIEWEYASEIERISPLVTVMGDALNLTKEQIDNIFIEASKI
ncbi:hypothetical protein AAX29_00554 [Aliarcobacter thereius]|uniref:Uncharacterized protein n=1 Tax=Aliarcobacter thereius TaxID=544718 RepID=A0A1C0B7F5_9BACT|nr:hypothetical protein [Aliarcobacter thereius]OCL99513.1 hypothetical protein AAX29_00554 [Aliarcobacter thereius]